MKFCAAATGGGMELFMRFLLSCLLIFCFLLFPIMSLASDEEATVFEQTEEIAYKDVQAAVLVEAGSQQVLTAFNADTTYSVAGLCKLPAILVIAEAVDAGALTLTTEITISRRAAEIGGPSAFLEAGESVRAEYLMKAAAMICAGDAIIALGEHIFGTEGAFAGQIQSRLSELEINSAYEDGVGKGAMLNARMLAVLGAALMRSDCFRAYSKLTYEKFTHADGRETELANANRMLKDYGGCTGVATGSSAADGYCGVFFVTRGDTELVAVIIGAKNTNTRFDAARTMLDTAFAQTRAQKLAAKGEILAENVPVRGGKIRAVNLVAKETVVLLLERTDSTLTPVKDIPESLMAPLSASDVVGSISYQSADGVLVGKVELVPETVVDKLFFRDCVSSVLLTFLRM